MKTLDADFAFYDSTVYYKYTDFISNSIDLKTPMERKGVFVCMLNHAVLESCWICTFQKCAFFVHIHLHNLGQTIRSLVLCTE